MITETLITPYWFDQRQCKAEAAGEDFYCITAPNMRPSYVGVRRLDNGRFQGYFRHEQDGPDDAITEVEFDTPYNAWEGTFELYREKMIL